MFSLSRRWPIAAPPRQAVLLAALTIVLFVLLGVLDHRISAWAQGWSAELRSFFMLVTRFGQSDWVLTPSLIAVILLAVAGRLLPGWSLRIALRQLRAIAGFIFLGVALPGLVANGVKRLIGRGRPEVFDVAGAFDFRVFHGDAAYESFPSGHTTTAFALCFVLAFLAPQGFRNLLFLAILIGLSRIIVGAHYPTDVLGGMLTGTVGAYAVRNLFATRGWVFRPSASGAIEMRPLAAWQRVRRERRRGQAPAAA